VVCSAVVPGEVLVLVTGSSLDVVKDSKRLSLMDFPGEIIYAKIIRLNEKHSKAVIIDKELNLSLIDLLDMKHNPQARLNSKFNLLSDSCFFETFYVKTEGT